MLELFCLCKKLQNYEKNYKITIQNNGTKNLTTKRQHQNLMCWTGYLNYTPMEVVGIQSNRGWMEVIQRIISPNTHESLLQLS
jgi:hypothetical protein